MTTLTVLLIIIGLGLNFWAGLRLQDIGLQLDPVGFMLGAGLVSAVLTLALCFDLGMTREVQPAAVFIGLWLVAIGALVIMAGEIYERTRGSRTRAVEGVPNFPFVLFTSLISLVASILGILSFYLQHAN